MFANVVRRQTHNVLKRRFCSQPPKREVSRVPTKGQSDGGHPEVLQKEPPVNTWFKEPAAWPIIAITLFACGFAGYKLFKVDAMSPEIHFSKKDRGSLDYIENDRRAEDAEKWGKASLIPGQKKSA